MLEVGAEAFVLRPVPSDPHRDANASTAQEVDGRDLLRGEGGLPLREHEDAADELEASRHGREVTEQHHDLVEGVGRRVGRARKAADRARTEPFRCRAEDVVVGHEVGEARVLGGARPVADRVGVSAAVGLREDHSEIHAPTIARCISSRWRGALRS